MPFLVVEKDAHEQLGDDAKADAHRYPDETQHATGTQKRARLTRRVVLDLVQRRKQDAAEIERHHPYDLAHHTLAEEVHADRTRCRKQAENQRIDAETHPARDVGAQHESEPTAQRDPRSGPGTGVKPHARHPPQDEGKAGLGNERRQDEGPLPEPDQSENPGQRQGEQRRCRQQRVIAHETDTLHEIKDGEDDQ